jgi:TIR domain
VSGSETFFSWASPDRETAALILGRLRDAGLPVTDYSNDMLPGDVIPQWVVDAIEQARIVVACVSAAALAHSNWVKTEVDQAAARLVRSDHPLERLVVVRIGRVPDGWQSALLQANPVRYYDLAGAPGEADLERLVVDLRVALDLDAPYVIPAALCSMTADEFGRLRRSADPAQTERLVALCRRLGMPDTPELWDELARRHGATSEDFAPYADGRSLIELTQAVVRHVNERRRDNGRPPVYLRWYSRAELLDTRLRPNWKKAHTILFVDSVSALYPAVMAGLPPPSQSEDPRKAAVIYLPPYTRHTGDLERLIEASLAGQLYLSDTFQSWRDENGLASLAFDIPTETSLRRWLDQLFLALDDSRPPPWKPNVNRMSPGPPRRGSLMSGVPWSRP